MNEFRRCACCGTTFSAERSTRIYCCDACRQQAKRDRSGGRRLRSPAAMREARRIAVRAAVRPDETEEQKISRQKAQYLKDREEFEAQKRNLADLDKKLRAAEEDFRGRGI